MQTGITAFSFVLVGILAGCATLGDSPEPIAESPLAPTLEAHGGLEHWQAQGTLTYLLDGFPLSPQAAKPHRSTVDLRTRRNYIVGEEFTVGFDGEHAWSLPTLDAVGLPLRFFNLGSFYFIGMPFVFADPGVSVTPEGTRVFRGKTYRTYRATYGSSIGHSSADDYVLYVDPETDRLHLIHHSVTELSPDLRVTWLFEEWQEVDGLLMVKKLTYFPDWNEGELADGAVTLVSDMCFSAESPDPRLYTPPIGAAVAEI